MKTHMTERQEWYIRHVTKATAAKFALDTAWILALCLIPCIVLSEMSKMDIGGTAAGTLVSILNAAAHAALGYVIGHTASRMKSQLKDPVLFVRVLGGTQESTLPGVQSCTLDVQMVDKSEIRYGDYVLPVIRDPKKGYRLCFLYYLRKE